MCAPAFPLFLSFSQRAARIALITPLITPFIAPFALAGPAHAHGGAADPGAPTAPLTYPGPVQQRLVVDALPQPEAWRQANDAVAAFPRGHADILAWEAKGRAASNPAATAAPADEHHHGKLHDDHPPSAPGSLR